MPEHSQNDRTAGPTHLWSKADSLALLASLVVGFSLAIAPHLTTLASRGTLDYLADPDDVLYLSIARAPYHGESALRDPFARRSDAMPTLYPWAQFVPFTLPTRWLGLGLLRASLIWRTIGGLSLGGSLFVLFRRLLGGTGHPTAWSLGASLVCLSDAGFVDGRMIVADYDLFRLMLHGSTPMNKADALGQYRVVTPLLNLPFLLLMVAALVPSNRGRRARTMLGAVCLGLCFQLYFFYWTAAVAALLASAIVGLAVGRRGAEHRANVRSTALVLVGGLAIGLPQVHANARLFSNPEVRPILERMGRGRVLDADDPARTRYLANYWAWAKLGVGGLAILAFRVRGLGLVWWLTLSGFLMANGAILSGLEFENFHWVYVHAPMGEILLLALAARLLDRWNSGHAVRDRILWLLPAFTIAVAGAWRPFEATRAPDPIRLNQLVDAIRSSHLDETLGRLGPDRVLSAPRDLDVAILFSRCGLLWQEPHSYLSSLNGEESLHERHALNAWLQGETVEGYRQLNREYPFLVVPSGDTARWSAEDGRPPS